MISIYFHLQGSSFLSVHNIYNSNFQLDSITEVIATHESAISLYGFTLILHYNFTTFLFRPLRNVILLTSYQHSDIPISQHYINSTRFEMMLRFRNITFISCTIICINFVE